MRRAAPSMGIILALVAPWPAAAQDAPRPRLTVVIKPPAPAPALPRSPTLRKPLEPLAAGRARPVRVSLAPTLATPTAKGGVTPLRGLNGPSPAAAAAQCRAQCAQARYLCKAQDAGDCDTVWGQCVVRCSGANYTETPDLALSGAYRPLP